MEHIRSWKSETGAYDDIFVFPGRNVAANDVRDRQQILLFTEVCTTIHPHPITIQPDNHRPPNPQVSSSRIRLWYSSSIDTKATGRTRYKSPMDQNTETSTDGSFRSSSCLSRARLFSGSTAANIQPFELSLELFLCARYVFRSGLCCCQLVCLLGTASSLSASGRVMFESGHNDS